MDERLYSRPLDVHRVSEYPEVHEDDYLSIYASGCFCQTGIRYQYEVEADKNESAGRWI